MSDLTFKSLFLFFVFFVFGEYELKHLIVQLFKKIVYSNKIFIKMFI